MASNCIKTGPYTDMDFTYSSEEETRVLLKEVIPTKPKRSSSIRNLIKWTSIVILFCLPGALILLFRPGSVYTIINHLETQNYGDCGTSVEEARAKNCIFDNLSFSWHRPECAYPDVVTRYHKRVNMTYYSDSSLEAKYLVPIEEVLRGDHPNIWTSKVNHIVHCAFILEKIHIAYLTHGALDSQARSLHHTNHCTEILLDDLLHELPCDSPPCERVTRTKAKFTTCERL